MRLDWLSLDGKKLLVTRILRTFAYGYLAVVLGVYLDLLGLDPTQIGFVLTAAIAGSAAMTIFWSLIADRYGRRRTVATMAVLMALGGVMLIMNGLLAEMVSRTYHESQDKPIYVIREVRDTTARAREVIGA